MKKEYFFCCVDDLKRETKITKWIDDLKDEISAIYIDGKYYVYSTICPHFGGEFEIERKPKTLRCKWHGWKFDIITGRSLTEANHYKSGSIIYDIIKGKKNPIGCFPFNGQLQKYNFKINDNNLEIILDDSI